MTVPLERALRKELNMIAPTEALFRLASYIEVQQKALTVTTKTYTEAVDKQVAIYSIILYEKLLEELAKTGKISPPKITKELDCNHYHIN